MSKYPKKIDPIIKKYLDRIAKETIEYIKKKYPEAYRKLREVTLIWE